MEKIKNGTGNFSRNCKIFRINRLVHFLIFLTFCLLSGLCNAEITYDPDRNVIRITGFPEIRPATLTTLLETDRKQGWKKVNYDAKSKTYRINANLWIGDETGLGAFLRMGSPETPELTVIMDGSIWVKPPRKSAKRSDGRYSIMNGLIIGDPDNEKIRVTVKFNCKKQGEYALAVGRRSKASGTIPRGSIRIYNSEITAMNQDGRHNWSCRYRGCTFGWYASEVDIRNTTFSWFHHTPFYGIDTGIFKDPKKKQVKDIIPNPIIQFRNCRFVHGGCGFLNGILYIEDCEFENLHYAIRDGGSLAAKIVNCKFKNNRVNFTLGSVYSKGIILRDCEIGKSVKPDQVKRNRLNPAILAKRGVPVFPACIVQQVLTVKVVDSTGKPVAGVVVEADCPGNPEMAVQGISITGKNGLTPSDLESGLLITISRLAASNKPGPAKQETFKYRIKARHSGISAQIIFDSVRASDKPLIIRLTEGGCELSN